MTRKRLKRTTSGAGIALPALYTAALYIAALFFCPPAAFGQTENYDDPASFIGTTLTELISLQGAPKQVYAVRGQAAWQDDVVFVYDKAEFYVFGSRVWQLKIPSAYNIKNGDKKADIIKALGEGRDYEGYTLFQRPSRVWPIILRVDWDKAGRAAGIYLYRPDF